MRPIVGARFPLERAAEALKLIDGARRDRQGRARARAESRPADALGALRTHFPGWRRRRAGVAARRRGAASTGVVGWSRQGSPPWWSCCSCPEACSLSGAAAPSRTRSPSRSARPCPAVAGRSCPTSGSWPTTARRRTTTRHPRDRLAAPGRASRSLERQAKPFARPGRPVLPAFELIAAIVTSEPGNGGDHSMRQDDATIARYLRVAGAQPDAPAARHPARVRALPPGGARPRALAEGAGRGPGARPRVEHEAAAAPGAGDRLDGRRHGQRGVALPVRNRAPARPAPEAAGRAPVSAT